MNRLGCDSEHVPIQEPDREAVRLHLAKILESGGFAKSDRLCRFLRFTVEAKLNGEESQIKEYVLGREVFDRNGDYDPRLDPIVRVEARRLRTKLEEYYSATGPGDSVRIEFPKGSYVPVIHPGEKAASPITRAPRWTLVVVLLVVLLAAAGLVGYRVSRPSTSEIVAVAPAGWLWGDEPADAVRLEEGLAERISIELANQRAARVVGWPLMLRYRTERQEFRRMAAEVGAAKVLLIRCGGTCGDTGGVAVFVLGAASGEKFWVGEYAPRDNQLELARMIVKDFVAKQKDIDAAPK
jgi:hypothetical protein